MQLTKNKLEKQFQNIFVILVVAYLLSKNIELKFLNQVLHVYTLKSYT